MNKICPGILVFVLVAGQSAGRNVKMVFAEDSWPSVITTSGAIILLGHIRRVEGRQPVGVNQLTGTAVVDVMRVLTPRDWQAPPELPIRFTKLASPKSALREGNGGWNGVDVMPGALLLIGMDGEQHVDRATPVSLRAVSQVSSQDDPHVVAVIQALHIEATQNPRDRLPLLWDAVNSDLPVLESYGHFALGREQRVPREDATSLEITLLLDATKSDERRISAESTLDLELWVQGDPHDSANNRIVTALLQVLVRQEPGLQPSTIINLHRLFFSFAPSDPQTAQMYRSGLLNNVQVQDVKAIRTALDEARKDPHVRMQANDLLRLFPEPSK